MPRPKVINPERDAAIVASYLSGLNLDETGKAHGLSGSHVARLLVRLGVERRPSGGGRPIPERDRQIAELYASGLTLTEVAERVGMSFNGALRSLERQGIPRRGKGERRKPSGSPAKAARNAAIVQAYRTGLSLDAVGACHGISRSRVQEILKAAGEPRRQRRHGASGFAAPRAAPLVPEDAAPIIPAGVKVTVCPCGKDQRFTATEAPRFFAAGAVLPPSPWVQAVTGSRA